MGGVKPCLEARKERKVSRGAKRMKEKRRFIIMIIVKERDM